MLGSAFPICPTLTTAEGSGSTEPRLAWPNGYRYRLRYVITAAIHQQPGGAQGWAKLRIVNSVLKSVANGGHVVNDAAWPDIRLESGSGTALGYELESWNASTGVLVIYLLLTNFVASAHYTVSIYYGKAGITANEADPLKCWNGFAQSVNMATGVDMSGNSRDLALTGVSAATLFGGAAGDFA